MTPIKYDQNIGCEIRMFPNQPLLPVTMIHYEMHSADNERKSAVNERFVGTLKKKIYKYMTSMSIYILKN